MLRRAMDLGGFHQVIFICHTPLVWELADTVLSVGGGCVVMGDREAAVTTESPPPSQRAPRTRAVGRLLVGASLNFLG